MHTTNWSKRSGWNLLLYDDLEDWTKSSVWDLVRCDVLEDWTKSSMWDLVRNDVLEDWQETIARTNSVHHDHTTKKPWSSRFTDTYLREKKIHRQVDWTKTNVAASAGSIWKGPTDRQTRYNDLKRRRSSGLGDQLGPNTPQKKLRAAMLELTNKGKV